MSTRTIKRLLLAATALAVVGLPLTLSRTVSAETTKLVPAPAFDDRAITENATPENAAPKNSAGENTATAILAGGCFWGVQGVFQHVKGVTSAVSGYAGGAAADASYPVVSEGTTGHAESVKITYDPRVVSYGTLLRIYFSVVTDPTLLNAQGPDQGPQYRSNIFATTPGQAEIAKRYIAQLDQAHVYDAPIVTAVTPFTSFFAAEAYHQNYLTNHPHNLYIALNDMPKVEGLKTLFQKDYRPDPVLAAETN